MAQIRQYSKEWFAARANEKQKNAIKKFSKEQFETTFGGKKNYERVINKDLLVGTKEQINNRIKKAFANGKEVESRQIIEQFGGVDNIFDIIDTDGDGKITKKELATISAIDTPDSWEVVEDDKSFSVNDLHHLFVNLNNAEGAKIEYKGNETVYTYKSGSKTTVVQDDTGDVKQVIKETSLKDNSKSNEIISYDEKVKVTYDYDSQGRQIHSKIDHAGTKDDSETFTTYNKNGVRVETYSTVGRNFTVVLDGEDNVISSYDVLKYDLNKDTPFKQQNVGDCWLLSQYHAMQNTSLGKKIIDDSIHQNEDGSVTVTLKGAGRSYTYTPEQICAEEYVTKDKYYSKGNAKVKVMELAFTDLRKELLEENSKLSMMVKYSFSATKKNPLEDGYFKEAMLFLTGKEPETAYLRSNVEKQLKLKQDNPDSYAMVTAFKFSDKSFGYFPNQSKPKITTLHEYSVTRVTEDTVYVVNPWNTAEEIAYPKEKFLKNCFGVGNIDLSDVEQ